MRYRTNAGSSKLLTSSPCVLRLEKSFHVSLHTIFKNQLIKVIKLKLKMGIEGPLISAVYLRSFLYTKSDPKYKLKKLIAKAWEEIAEEVGADGNN